MTVFPTYIMHKGAKFCHLKIKKKKYSTFDNNSSTTFFFPPQTGEGMKSPTQMVITTVLHSSLDTLVWSAVIFS